MKKIITLLLILILCFSLVGCGPKEYGWKLGEDSGNGIKVLVSEIPEEMGEWYASVDVDTGYLLSVNLKYPEEFGTPGTVMLDGAEMTTGVTVNEFEHGGVIFMVPPIEMCEKEYADKAVLTLTFSEKTVEFAFTPKSIFESLE